MGGQKIVHQHLHSLCQAILQKIHLQSDSTIEMTIIRPSHRMQTSIYVCRCTWAFPRLSYCSSLYKSRPVVPVMEKNRRLADIKIASSRRHSARSARQLSTCVDCARQWRGPHETTIRANKAGTIPTSVCFVHVLKCAPNIPYGMMSAIDQTDQLNLI